MGSGQNQPRGRFDRVVRRPPPPNDEGDSSEDEAPPNHLLQSLFHQRDDIQAAVRQIHQGTEEAAVIQGVMAALECLLFEHPPRVEPPEDFVLEQSRWAMRHPRFIRSLDVIREAFRGVIPAGDLFAAMIRYKLERVLRGAETLTVVTITCHVDDGNQDPPGPSPPPGPPPPGPSPPGPSVGNRGSLAGRTGRSAA